MDKTIIKALANGVISWILIALILMWKDDITFLQGLKAPYTILLAVAAAVGSYIGYQRQSTKISIAACISEAHCSNVTVT